MRPSASHALERATRHFATARTLPQLGRTVKEFAEDLGFDHVVYWLPRVPGVVAGEPVAIITYPDEWTARYIEQNYLDIDPVVLEAARSIVPTDWSTLTRRSKRVRQLFDEASACRIGNQGVTIAMRGAAFETALFSVTANCLDDEWLKRKREAMPALQTAGFLLHQSVLGLYKPDAEAPRLAPREAECLRLCARGLRDADIADRMKISPSVVRAYLESVRYKLAASTRPHMVAQAIKLGILNPDLT